MAYEVKKTVYGYQVFIWQGNCLFYKQDFKTKEGVIESLLRYGFKMKDLESIQFAESD